MRPRTVAELQAAVGTAVRAHRLAADPAARLLDLVSEVGELSKAFAESTGYGAAPFRRTSSWDDELGDVAFSLLALATETATPLDEAVDSAIDKIDRRVARTGSASSGGSGHPV